MKKVKQIYDGSTKLSILLILTLFVCTCCSAHPSKTSNFKKQGIMGTDSVMKTSIGDSIYKIITEATKIKAEEIKLTNDSTDIEKEMAIAIKARYIPLVQFILSDPRIFGGDLVTYANFMPCFKLTFVRKKEACILNFDFGLKKWNICDSSGKQIKIYDLSSDDMLRFANIIFPENTLYQNLIKSDKR